MWERSLDGGLSCVTGLRSVGNFQIVLAGFFINSKDFFVVVVNDVRTVFLPVLEFSI